MFFRKYQVGYLATRSQNNVSIVTFEQINAVWIEVFFENSCEDYLSLFNLMGISNVAVLIEENIQNMADIDQTRYAIVLCFIN